MGIERFPRQIEGTSTKRFSCFTRPGFRMSCQMAASKSWNFFHIDLKTVFLQGQFQSVNRDVVCELPPEAGHPPENAARLKKPAYDMNDAPRRWRNVSDRALCNYRMPRELIDFVTCCTQPKRVSHIGTCRALHKDMALMTSHLNRVCDHKEMQHSRECWIALKEAQLQANPWQESGTFL